jgi:hypothetical protein
MNIIILNGVHYKLVRFGELDNVTGLQVIILGSMVYYLQEIEPNSSIEMIEINESYLPLRDGLYLVRTLINNPDRNWRYIEAKVRIIDDLDGKKRMKIDVGNEVPTHISSLPLEYYE